MHICQHTHVMTCLDDLLAQGCSGPGESGWHCGSRSRTPTLAITLEAGPESFPGFGEPHRLGHIVLDYYRPRAT